MVKFKGINHLAMVTSDMDKTIRFWRDLLGMKLVAGQGETGFRQYFFEISKGSYLSFYEWTGAEPIIEKDAGRVWIGPIVFDHVCFEVENREQLWELKDKIEAMGEWVSEEMDNGFIHSVFVFDPNNISVEICFRVQGIDPEKEMKMVDRNPASAAMEGRLPQEGIWPKPEKPTPEELKKVYEGDLKKIITGKDTWPHNRD